MTLFLAIFVVVVAAPVAYVMCRTRPWLEPQAPVIRVRVYPAVDADQIRRMTEAINRISERMKHLGLITREDVKPELERMDEAMRSPYPPSEDQKGKPR